MSDGTFQIPPGMVVCASWGMARTETAFALLEARSFTEAQGAKNIRWVHVPGALVSKSRNDAARSLLADPNAQWMLMIDLDMAFPADAILRILRTAYATHPHLDLVGAYCNLRGEVGLPTIDTGTGTWEVWYPESGVKDVMRTGAAFLLVKRHVFERIPGPWFALRIPQRPLDAIAEVDTYCRTIFDGRNPFRGRPDGAWERMTELASEDRSAVNWVPAEVGEDSSFCDRVTAAGMRIGVDTSIQVQHITTQMQNWEHLRRKQDERAREERLLSGLTA